MKLTRNQEIDLEFAEDIINAILSDDEPLAMAKKILALPPKFQGCIYRYWDRAKPIMTDDEETLSAIELTQDILNQIDLDDLTTIPDAISVAFYNWAAEQHAETKNWN